MIKIVLARQENKELYKNVFNILQNELSIYNDEFRNLDANGYFSPNTVDVYFQKDKSIFPFIIYDNDRVAGVVILSKEPYVKKGCDFCIQEIFLLNFYRHKGISTEVCLELFSKYKGKYCLVVYKENKVAMRFWNKIFSEHCTDVFEIEMDEYTMAYEFNIKATSE